MGKRKPVSSPRGAKAKAAKKGASNHIRVAPEKVMREVDPALVECWKGAAVEGESAKALSAPPNKAFQTQMEEMLYGASPTSCQPELKKLAAENPDCDFFVFSSSPQPIELSTPAGAPVKPGACPAPMLSIVSIKQGLQPPPLLTAHRFQQGVESIVAMQGTSLGWSSSPLQAAGELKGRASTLEWSRQEFEDRAPLQSIGA